VKSIKTGLVVVVMLVVVYGVWQMINKKPIGPPQGGEMMSWGSGSLDFQSPEGVPSISPPNVQGPEAGAQGAANPSEGVMPDLQPAPSAVTPVAGGGTSPYSGDGHQHGSHQSGSHEQAGHDHSQGSGQPSQFGSHSRGAPVVSPSSGAPVVGPNEASDQGGSAYRRESRPASVYGQAEAYGGSMENSEHGAHGSYEAGAGALSNTRFQMTWEKVQGQLDRGEYAEALAALSIWYGSSDVPPDIKPQMLELLDQLAGAVIYSPEHHLEEPYEVQPGETLEDIALRYQVPWQLLANINGISDPGQLQPGQRLKVIRGPFNALISLDRQELTLIVDGRYAGRFSIELGNDPQPRTGEFAVREKETEKTFIDRDGRPIPPGEAANPYGPYWIGLDGRLGIHGAPSSAPDGSRSSTGSIVVSPDDARDLFAILSEESRVVIRR